MNELIKIENNNGIEAVNARELHEFLESKRQFGNWITQRIESYGFKYGEDFTINKYVIGKATQKDYFISLDMAKELSMVENNQKGREARRYFIMMEKKAKYLTSPELTEAEIVQKALQIQQKKIEVLSIKAQVADEIANSEGLFLPSIAGKMISGDPNLFCQWLVDNKIMFRQDGKLVPYSGYDKKYFEVKVSKYGKRSTVQSYFTSRGVMWIQTKFLKKNNLLQLDYSEYV